MADEVEKIGKITSSKATGIEKMTEIDHLPTKKTDADRDRFDDAMRVGRGAEDYQKQEQVKNSLMDEVRDLNRRTDSVMRVAPEELAVKSKEVIAQIQEIKGKLETPNLELKSSYQRILRNKLEHIDESLKGALDKAGLEYVAPEEIKSTMSTPINRFLGLLTHGQAQMERLNGEVQRMGLSKDGISPANMLAMQLKVGYMQQELEFFSSLLNKALESTKTIMNVQV